MKWLVTAKNALKGRLSAATIGALITAAGFTLPPRVMPAIEVIKQAKDIREGKVPPAVIAPPIIEQPDPEVTITDEHVVQVDAAPIVSTECLSINADERIEYTKIDDQEVVILYLVNSDNAE